MDASSCCFCKQTYLRNCLTRSLYHKYNDSADKALEEIDALVGDSRSKIPIRLKYQEMQYTIDLSEIMSKYNSPHRSDRQMTELLQYYKFRKFVPIFLKSNKSRLVVDSIYCYYYEKLKLYYNAIKRNLNMTVDQSSKTQQSESLLSISDKVSQNSHILPQLSPKASKQNIRQFQTQSKALESVITILKQNEERLKKIKTLKTQDCADSYNDLKQLRSRKKMGIADHLQMISGSETRNFLKKKKPEIPFYRYLDDGKSQKINQSHFKVKLNRKSIQSLKNNSQNSSHYHSKNKKTTQEGQKKNLSRSRKKIIEEKSSRRSQQKGQIRSLPKSGIQFQIRPSRSLSTISLKMTNKITKIGSQAALKKENDYISPYQTNRIQIAKKKNQNNTIRKHIKNTVTVEQTDNITSMRKKKLQELKLRSNKKKRTSKGKQVQ